MKITQYLYRYLSPKALFCIDLIVSVLSSLAVLFVLNFYALSNSYKGIFSTCWFAGAILFTIVGLLLFKVENIAVRHITIRDFLTYAYAIILKEVLLFASILVLCGFNDTFILCVICDGLLTLFALMGVRVAMILAYDFYKSKLEDAQDCKRVLVYGTSSKSVAAIKRFHYSKHHRVVGFISNHEEDRSLQLGNYPVFYYKTTEDVVKIARNLTVSSILFMSSDDVQKEKDNLIHSIASHNISALILPPVDEISGNYNVKPQIRNVRIEDLLGRPEIEISLTQIKSNFKDKVIMVTGAAGSIGSELCRQLATFGVRQLILFDNNETPMHNLRLELEARFPSLNFVPVIGSVRHIDRVEYSFNKWKPQVVFHAAAYKHVPLMEENPCEAVFANVHGTRIVADKCIEHGVEKMVMISTDKAVNPTNVMGCSKRLAEIYVQSLGLAIEQGKVKGTTKFVTTRFGNVLGSNGSVIPRFREQIENGGPVTVTHPDITRFFMTIPEACRLVMEAATMSKGNQIFVFDMGDPVKIYDLATKMIELAGLKLGEDIQIKITGLRPGEKLYEEVLANTENTLPTSHDRIRIAKVREYEYDEVLGNVNRLTELSMSVNIPEMIQLMKKIVPEYKSKNSVFEQYDKQ